MYRPEISLCLLLSVLRALLSVRKALAAFVRNSRVTRPKSIKRARQQLQAREIRAAAKAGISNLFCDLIFIDWQIQYKQIYNKCLSKLFVAWKICKSWKLLITALNTQAPQAMEAAFRRRSFTHSKMNLS